jgi:ABC-2 type transport system permease protein
MKAFYLLARLRTVELVRNRSSLGIFIGLPLILLLAVGGIFAAGHPFERRQVAVVATPATLTTVRQALAGYPEVHLLEMVDRQVAVAQLRSHILDAVLTSEPQAPEQLRLFVSDRGRLLSQALSAALAASLPKITVETVASPRFGYVHHLFSGLVAFNILVTGLLGMGAAMARYRQIQLLKKLALTPLWRGTFVAAQLASRSFLGLLQVVALIIAAKFLFALPLSLTSSLWIVGVAALGLLTFMGVGFLLAAAIRSEGVLVEGVSALMTPLVLLSEMFFPLTELPRPLQVIGELLPSTHLVRLLRLGVLGDGSLIGAPWLPSLLLLSAWLLVSYVAAVVLFRWHD